jgi:hypothetical protein
MLVAFEHWQQDTTEPATEQTVSLHVGCVVESHELETKEPVNEPDPP